MTDVEELVERAIRNSSKTRDIVLDPFGGSGTTLIAAEWTNRQARLIELDPRYCDVIVKRWEVFTGAKAALEMGEPSERAVRSPDKSQAAAVGTAVRTRRPDPAATQLGRP